MWPLLLGLWKARRARKAAVTAIAPFVQRSRRRLGDIPETAWLDPYLVGFVVMFITLVARRQVDALDSQALGLAQCSAWGEITGMKPDLIGEETLHCCEIGDRDFERGCRDAMTVDLALYRSSIMRHGDLGVMRLQDDSGFDIAGERDCEVDDIMQLWDGFFEAQVLQTGLHRHAPERASDVAHRAG